MFWIMYFAIGVGCFLSFYEKLGPNEGLGSMIAAGISAAIWPVYWGYRITEKLDPQNR